MREVVERTADACFMPLTVGGGIRKVEDVRAMLLAGADKVSMNTAALDDPNLINASAEGFGTQCVVVAIDARRDGNGGWIVHTHGGRRPTQWQAVDWAVEAARRGAGEILLTSMDSDGTKKGYDLKLTAAVSEAIGIPVIASGGAGDIDHMAEVLSVGKADAVLAASIFHFGHYTVGDVKHELATHGIPVRELGRR
jgi:cyclase